MSCCGWDHISHESRRERTNSKQRDSQRKAGRWVGSTYEVKGMLPCGLLPEERDGPRVGHDGRRMLRYGMREALGGVEERVEEGDGLLARGGKGMQARGGDVVGDASRLCLQRGQHRRRDFRWAFCHDASWAASCAPKNSNLLTLTPKSLVSPRWTTKSVRKIVKKFDPSTTACKPNQNRRG